MNHRMRSRTNPVLETIGVGDHLVFLGTEGFLSPSQTARCRVAIATPLLVKRPACPELSRR